MEARDRIAKAFSKDVRGGDAFRWLVAESSGAIVGATRTGVIAVPPIYHLAGKLASFLCEETFITMSAPSDAFPSLVAAAEHETQLMGAVSYLAASAPAQRRKLGALEARDYRIITHYLVKHDLSHRAAPTSVRAATHEDVTAIVRLGAQAQNALADANPRMWTPHREAPSRFGAWMHYSLTLPDRRILVFGERPVTGFVIA